MGTIVFVFELLYNMLFGRVSTTCVCRSAALYPQLHSGTSVPLCVLVNPQGHAVVSTSAVRPYRCGGAPLFAAKLHGHFVFSGGAVPLQAHLNPPGRAVRLQPCGRAAVPLWCRALLRRRVALALSLAVWRRDRVTVMTSAIQLCRSHTTWQRKT